MIVKAISYLKLVLILHSLYFRKGGKCEYYKLLRLRAFMTWSIRAGAKEAVNYGQSWFSVAHEYYEISVIVVGIVIMIIALTMIETILSSRSPSWWSSPGSRSLPHLISVVRGVEILQGVVRLTWCDHSLASHRWWLSRWCWFNDIDDDNNQELSYQNKFPVWNYSYNWFIFLDNFAFSRLVQGTKKRMVG